MQKLKKIENYQLMQLLGKGANGFVYKGLNTNNGSLVAVKQIFIGKSEIKAIKTQLGLLKNLDHPRIVKFIDAIQKENRIYLILQYMQGGSLGSLVKKSPLDEDVAKIYIKQILNGLVFLHKQQVIHRDIKGANILLTKNGQIKLADFGVAVRLEDSQKTISAAGSPYWMAPEIISSGGEQPSAKCDIWSLGCTLIQLLTGNPPYHDLLQFPALFRIVQDQHPPLPECSNQCKQFLLSCFVKNPKNRPSAEQLLGNQWLKNTGQVSLKSLQLQQKLQQQISLALKSPINYAQLQGILKKTKNSLHIIKNKYFQAIVNDKKYPNMQKSQFIIKLMQNDPDVALNLYNTGLIQSQLQRIGQRTEASEDNSKIFIELFCSFTTIYQKKLSQIQNCTSIAQNAQFQAETIQYIIVHKCIPIYSKFLTSSIKQKKTKLKITLLHCLNIFVQSICNRKKSNCQHQGLQQLILLLEQTGSLRQILTLQPVPIKNQKQQPISIYITKLKIISKIIRYFYCIVEIKQSFIKYFNLCIAQIMKDGFVDNDHPILLIKFAIVRQLVGYKSCKTQLEKNGFIYRVCQYYVRISSNLQGNSAKGSKQKLSKTVTQKDIQILNLSLSVFHEFVRYEQGYEINRLVQFQRHGGFESLQSIFQCMAVNKKYLQNQQSSQLASLVSQIQLFVHVFQKLHQ